MPAKIIEGNLLTCDAQYIVHQCNTCTWSAAHLAYDIFKKFPHADIYSDRRPTKNNSAKKDNPGEIIIRGDGKNQRFVIAILGQVFPGKPRNNQQHVDSFKHRKKYFFEGLKKISKIKDIKSIAFPWGIGCGVAGGNWQDYQKLIDKFADAFPHIEVQIIKLK